jgi:hypothetical protein
MTSEVDYSLSLLFSGPATRHHITTVEVSWLGPLPGLQSHDDSFI